MMLVVAMAIASMGLLAHNILSLPLPLLSPANVGPLIVYAGLLAWHRLSRGANAAHSTLLLWTALNFGGGILTALPFPILPFEPEQTLAHYLAHAIYALAQVPLLWLLISAKHERSRSSDVGGWEGVSLVIERLPKSVRPAVRRALALARASGRIA